MTIKTMTIKDPRMLIVSALLFALGRSSHADTYPRQNGVDALHYSFALTLRDTSDVIDGETQIRLRVSETGVKQVTFDLVNRAGERGMAVSAVTMDGKALVFSHASDRLTVTLRESFLAERQVTLTVRYSGVPAAGLRIGPNRHGDRVFFSENWPDHARHWLPMIDHPYDKATSEFILIAPSQYQVVANGLLVEELDLPGGVRRTHWKQSVPIASWLYALGVARFAVHHAGLVKGVELDSYVFQVEVTLAQTQAGEVFRLPIEVGLRSKPGEPMKVEKAMLSERSARFTFAAEVEPLSVVIDPDTWLLMDAGSFVKSPSVNGR